MKYVELEILETKHLILRKFRADDAEGFYERVAGSQEVTKYMLWQPHKTVFETQESLNKILERYQNGQGYTWGIALREDDSIIGRIDLLRFDEAKDSCSFAYMLGKDFWGQGYGTEALKAVFSFAFEKMKIKSIVADHMRENKASGKVMQTVGMKYVKTYLAKYEKAGKLYDADEYVITYNDWNR